MMLTLDTFVLKNPAATVVPISDKGIAWPGDIGFKFKKQSDASTNSWADVENGISNLAYNQRDLQFG